MGSTAAAHPPPNKVETLPRRRIEEAWTLAPASTATTPPQPFPVEERLTRSREAALTASGKGQASRLLATSGPRQNGLRERLGTAANGEKPVDSEETELSEEERGGRSQGMDMNGTGGEGSGLATGRRQTLAETVQQVDEASSPPGSHSRQHNGANEPLQNGIGAATRTRSSSRCTPHTRKEGASPGGPEARGSGPSTSGRGARGAPGSPGYTKSGRTDGSGQRPSISALLGSGRRGKLREQALATTSVGELGMLGAEAFISDFIAPRDEVRAMLSRAPGMDQSEAESPDPLQPGGNLAENSEDHPAWRQSPLYGPGEYSLPPSTSRGSSPQHDDPLGSDAGAVPQEGGRRGQDGADRGGCRLHEVPGGEGNSAGGVAQSSPRDGSPAAASRGKDPVPAVKSEDAPEPSARPAPSTASKPAKQSRQKLQNLQSRQPLRTSLQPLQGVAGEGGARSPHKRSSTKKRKRASEGIEVKIETSAARDPATNAVSSRPQPGSANRSRRAEEATGASAAEREQEGTGLSDGPSASRGAVSAQQVQQHQQGALGSGSAGKRARSTAGNTEVSQRDKMGRSHPSSGGRSTGGKAPGDRRARESGGFRTPKASAPQAEAAQSESPLDLLARAGAVFSRSLNPGNASSPAVSGMPERPQPHPTTSSKRPRLGGWVRSPPASPQRTPLPIPTGIHSLAAAMLGSTPRPTAPTPVTAVRPSTARDRAPSPVRQLEPELSRSPPLGTGTRRPHVDGANGASAPPSAGVSQAEGPGISGGDRESTPPGQRVGVGVGKVGEPLGSPGSGTEREVSSSGRRWRRLVQRGGNQPASPPRHSGEERTPAAKSTLPAKAPSQPSCDCSDRDAAVESHEQEQPSAQPSTRRGSGGKAAALSGSRMPLVGGGPSRGEPSQEAAVEALDAAGEELSDAAVPESDITEGEEAPDAAVLEADAGEAEVDREAEMGDLELAEEEVPVADVEASMPASGEEEGEAAEVAGVSDPGYAAGLAVDDQPETANKAASDNPSKDACCKRRERERQSGCRSHPSPNVVSPTSSAAASPLDRSPAAKTKIPASGNPARSTTAGACPRPALRAPAEPLEQPVGSPSPKRAAQTSPAKSRRSRGSSKAKVSASPKAAISTLGGVVSEGGLLMHGGSSAGAGKGRRLSRAAASRADMLKSPKGWGVQKPSSGKKAAKSAKTEPATGRAAETVAVKVETEGQGLRPKRVRVPPVAYWASQSLVVDLESGTAAVHNPFADQLQFGTASKTSKPVARTAAVVKEEAKPSPVALKSKKHSQAKAGQGVKSPASPQPRAKKAGAKGQGAKAGKAQAPAGSRSTGDKHSGGRSPKGALSPEEADLGTPKGAGGRHSIAELAMQAGKHAAEASAQKGAPKGGKEKARKQKSGGSSRAANALELHDSQPTERRRHEDSQPKSGAPSDQPTGQAKSGRNSDPSHASLPKPAAAKASSKRPRADEGDTKVNVKKRKVGSGTGIGVFPRCASCKKARQSGMYCGTKTASKNCANWPPKADGPPASPEASKPQAPARQQERRFQGKAGGSGPGSGKATPSVSQEGESDGSDDGDFGTAESEERGGWSEEQLLALQDALRGVDPTAKGFWQRVAKKVPGGKTSDECHNQYLAQFGDTPAAKPGKTRKSAAGQKPQVQPRGHGKKKPTKVAVRKMAREARWQQRVSEAQPDDPYDSPGSAGGVSLEEARDKQEKADKYIDALLRRRGNKGRGWTIGAQLPSGAVIKRGNDALAQQISLAVAGSAPRPESDDEEEKDDYFSDASEEADGLEV